MTNRTHLPFRSFHVLHPLHHLGSQKLQMQSLEICLFHGPSSESLKKYYLKQDCVQELSWAYSVNGYLERKIHFSILFVKP